MDKNQSKSIISALCWVNRGYAASTLKEYEPTLEEIEKHKKVSLKYLKGKDLNEIDIKEAA
jgi:hypothetical protein